MKNTLSAFSMRSIFLIIFSFAVASCEKHAIRPETTVAAYKPNFVLAKTGNELTVLQEDPKTNLLRTPQDYEALVASGGTPLSRLPKDVQIAFGKGIVYRPGIGVVGVSYGNIRPLLSYDEFAQVLAAFGLDVKQGYFGLSQDPTIIAQLSKGGRAQVARLVDDQLMTDYDGYYCEAPHTCTKRDQVICMSGCDK